MTDPPPPPPPPPGVPPPGPPGPGWSTTPPPAPAWDPGAMGGPDGPGTPRVRVSVGGWLLVAGGAIAFLGAFLPWVSSGGRSINGFDDFVTSDLTVIESPGLASIVGGLIGIAFGVALVAAGRVLAVAILGIIFAAIGVLVGIGLLVIAGDVASWSDGSVGVGAIAQPVGPAIALAGAIVATAKRR